MKRCVLDASVTIKWFLPDATDEDQLPDAVDLLQKLGREELAMLQPPHWKAEVAAVLARRVPNEAVVAVADLGRLAGIEIVETPAIWQLAIAIAGELDHHLLDTLYHAIAIESGIDLVTADRRYFGKASRLGNIVLLGSTAIVPH